MRKWRKMIVLGNTSKKRKNRIRKSDRRKKAKIVHANFLSKMLQKFYMADIIYYTIIMVIQS